MLVVDFGVRMGLSYVLLKNAPVGSLIPLESLGLDPKSFSYLSSLWNTTGLMPLVKLTEAVSGVCLLLNRHVLIAALMMVPVWVGILCVTATLFPQGLWQNSSFLLLTLFLIFIRRSEVQYVENRLFLFRHPARSH